MERVVNKLFEMKDVAYRDFTAKLTPSVAKENIIGVRTPAIKNYAKEFSKDDDSRLFMKELPHRYYEENNLHAALIGLVSRDIDEALGYIEEFLPFVDNWATCDSLSPKKLFKRDAEKVYPKILQWLQSSHTYTVRFALVSLIGYFLDDKFKPEMLDLVASLRSEEYYVNIAIAWYFSFALIKQYDATIVLIEAQTLSRWIQNKSIQKAIESYRIGEEEKRYLRSLKL